MFREISLSRLLKGIAVFGVGFLLSVGLCGIDAHMHPAAEFGGSFLSMIGAVLGIVCAIGLVMAVLMLVLVAAVRGLGR